MDTCWQPFYECHMKNKYFILSNYLFIFTFVHAWMQPLAALVAPSALMYPCVRGKAGAEVVKDSILLALHQRTCFLLNLGPSSSTRFLKLLNTHRHNETYNYSHINANCSKQTDREWTRHLGISHYREMIMSALGQAYISNIVYPQFGASLATVRPHSLMSCFGNLLTTSSYTPQQVICSRHWVNSKNMKISGFIHDTLQWPYSSVFM